MVKCLRMTYLPSGEDRAAMILRDEVQGALKGGSIVGNAVRFCAEFLHGATGDNDVVGRILRIDQPPVHFSKTLMTASENRCNKERCKRVSHMFVTPRRRDAWHRTG